MLAANQFWKVQQYQCLFSAVTMHFTSIMLQYEIILIKFPPRPPIYPLGLPSLSFYSFTHVIKFYTKNLKRCAFL